MRTLMLAAVLVVGCGDDGPMSTPDAGADASLDCRDECSIINSPPPECFGEPCPCEGTTRLCDNELICQEWDDCDCYQCRDRYYCLCRAH